MGKILVPLDGSRSAELGLNAATRVAGDTGGELVLLWAVPFQGTAQGEQREHEQTEIRVAVAYLEATRQSLAAQGLTVRSLVLPGHAVRAILFAAEAEEVELISMATHGHGGSWDRLVGSVTAAVLRATGCPMLIAHSSIQPGKEALPWRTILVGLDGTPFAESALSYLVASGLGREASILLVRAVEPDPIDPALASVSEQALERAAGEALHRTEQHLQSAEAYLRATAETKLPRRHVRVIALAGAPASILADVAVGEHADLVVLATHGRRGTDQLLHGSVTQGVLRHGAAPMLILHGAGAPAD